MRSQQRAGFTLVELMVAMALTLFIMVILSQAFVTSLETFANMKGIGDMQVNLRTAGNILRSDLGNDHLEGKRRLSDFDTSALIVRMPPQAGFFVVRHGSSPSATSTAPYVNEGVDANNVNSFRARDQMIYMTVKRKGNRRENMFSTALVDARIGTAGYPPAFPGQGDLEKFFSVNTAYDVPPIPNLAIATWTQPYAMRTAAAQPYQPTAFYASQWAEVLYYLVRTGSTEEPNNPTSTLGTPTYALYRAEFVMVPDGGTSVSGLSSMFKTPAYTAPALLAMTQSTFKGMSCNPVAYPNPTPPPATVTTLTFFSPADAAAGRRLVPDLLTFTPPALPDDPSADVRFASHANHVCPNVISFHVQVMPTGGTIFIDPTNVAGAANGVYDTTKLSAGSAGLKAIQITLRVFDNASRQSRQMTIVQDL